MDLPKDEVKPYYDETKKRWIIPGEPEEEEPAAPPPPPPMAPVQSAQADLPPQPPQPPQPPLPGQQPETPETPEKPETEAPPHAGPPIKAFMPYVPEQSTESTAPSSTPQTAGSF